jgi:1-acyl-sn-glycerol-3-phosphate acyltransferase
MALYATYLTNYYGFKLKKVTASKEKKELRQQYAQKLLKKLNIEVNVINPEKLPKNGKFLLLCNHRSIIDPVIIEILMQQSTVYGHWIAKKELYNSFFFGTFVRNGGTILIDRETKQMGGFFGDIKQCVKEGHSVFIFPEGTRNKSNADLAPFQGGAQLIALKNRLPILPVFIRTQANDVLMCAIKSGKSRQYIDVVVGDVIAYNNREITLEDAYRKQFNLQERIKG